MPAVLVMLRVLEPGVDIGFGENELVEGAGAPLNANVTGPANIAIELLLTV